MKVTPLSPYDSNVSSVLSTELSLVTLDTLNMEVRGKEVMIFFRHNIESKDIKTAYAKGISSVPEGSGNAEVLTFGKDLQGSQLKWVPAGSSSIPVNAVVISRLNTGEEIFMGKFKEVKRGYGYVFNGKGLLFETEFYENFSILCNFNLSILKKTSVFLKNSHMMIYTTQNSTTQK